MQVLSVDKQKSTMRVQAGMRYTEFLREAQKAGVSVQVGQPNTLLPWHSSATHGSCMS
jgi:FAD/FMN-containing dehydrogenase